MDNRCLQFGHDGVQWSMTGLLLLNNRFVNKRKKEKNWYFYHVSYNVIIHISICTHILCIMLFYNITIETARVEFAYHLRSIKTRVKNIHIRTRHASFFKFYFTQALVTIYTYVCVACFSYLPTPYNNTYHYSARTLNLLSYVN